MKVVGFVGSAYAMDELPISAQQCINWNYTLIENENASANEVLLPTPGYKEVIEITDDSLPYGSFTRGIYKTTRGIGVNSPESTGSIIWVIGTHVYWYKVDGTYELLGEISNLDTKVRMKDDGFGLILADGANIYRLDLDTKDWGNVGFNLIDPDNVDFFGGYTIVTGKESGEAQNTFYFSELYNNSSDGWNSLRFASAEQSADPITAMIVAGSYIHMFGPQSHEMWTSTDDDDLPFQRSYASSGAIGIHAPKSLCKFGNNIFMLGTNGEGAVRAYMSQGTEMVRISTLALEQYWSKFVTDGCTTWTNSEEGADLVFFNFDDMGSRKEGKTYCYNIMNGTWTERASRKELTDQLFRWEPNFAVKLGDRTLVGDRFSTKLYELSNEYTTENGRNILRIRTTAHINAEQKNFKCHYVHFDMETGNGITDEDTQSRYTQAPKIMVELSPDRGRTYPWGRMEEQFGATGEYGTQVEFQGLGSHKNLTIKYSISDSVHTSIMNAFMGITVQQKGRGRF